MLWAFPGCWPGRWSSEGVAGNVIIDVGGAVIVVIPAVTAGA